MFFNILTITGFVLGYCITCCVFLTKDLAHNASRFLITDYPRFAKAWIKSFSVSCRNIAVTCIIILMIDFEQFTTSILDSVPLLLIFVLVVDVYFYCMHRLMHTNLFYKFHKQHHTEFHGAIASSGLDSGLIEHLLVSVGSIFVPLMILKPNQLVIILMCTYAGISSASSHSGYPHARRHYLHHVHKNVNYGTGLYLMDFVMGTLKE